MGDGINLYAKTEAEEVAKIARSGGEAKIVEVAESDEEKVRYLVLPTATGLTAKSVEGDLDERRMTPRRKRGVAKLSKFDSFLKFVDRHRTPETTIFVYLKNGGWNLRALFNPHAGGEGSPGHGDFGAHLALAHGEAFAAWDKVNGKPLSQADFAELVEARIAEITDPIEAFASSRETAARIQCEYATPSRMLGLSKGLSVRVESHVKEAINLANGETKFVYDESIRGDEGADLTVPGAFLATFPIFDGGTHYQIPIRIRYRATRGAGVVWSLQIYRMDLAIEHAIGEMIAGARAEGLTVFEGEPG